MVLKSQLNKDFFKPGEVAKMLNLTTRTIQTYCVKGILDERISATGQRTIPRDSLVKYLEENNLIYDDTLFNRQDVIYARVSTSKQKNSGDLEKQINSLKLFAIDNNPINLKIITDVASGLNDNRRGLNELIDLVLNNKVNRIFINYKDRLTRFGFNYLKKICDFHNVEIIIISDETKDKSLEMELAEDIISIIHSFSGKLYGLRKQVKSKIDKELEADIL